MANNNRKKSELAEELQQPQQDPNGNSTTPNEPDLTPEQRRILGKAYRMILNWPDDDAAQTASAFPNPDKGRSIPLSHPFLSVTSEE